MDKRKFNRGHKGKAGRKPKADELKLIEKLDSLIDKDAVIAKLLQMIKDDNFPALKLYMEYRFGKPKETVQNINTNYNQELTKEEADAVAKALMKKYY
tara:strand:+ start:193 stop:486 length:294 start_codon:yes stop_codon:yes gene_type:complete